MKLSFTNLVLIHLNKHMKSKAINYINVTFFYYILTNNRYYDKII